MDLTILMTITIQARPNPETSLSQNLGVTLVKMKS